MPAVTLDFTRPHVLRDGREYEAAVAELDALAYANPDEHTEAYDRMVFLSVLVEAYEQEHNSIDDSDVTPQEVVDFMLEQRALARTDLYDVLGSKGRVSEFFSGKRRLSIAQAKGLHELLHIPLELLLA